MLFKSLATSTLALSLALSLARNCGGTTPSTPADDAAVSTDVSAAPDVPAPPPAGPYEAHPPRLRRLTQSQYANSVRDLFGDAVVVPRALEPDTRTEGSSAVGASETTVSLRGTEQYQAAAYDVAEQVLRDPARRAGLVACTPSGPQDDACATTFVRTVGRRVLRRPLDDEERTRFVAVAGRAGAMLNDFHRGLEFALAALLQSPDFLFRAELGSPMGAARRYERYELASRLAFFLWNGPPDDALLDAAERGELEGAGLAREVDRLLASPKARRGFEAFLIDWLLLDKLDELSRDAVLFPSFAADFGPSAREEVLRTAAYIAFERDGDFRDLLTTRETFVNRRLAALYGLPFPVRDAPPTRFERVEFPASQPRRGLLGMAAFLALEAHPTSSSPTLRGKFVRENILCETVPQPPVNANTAIPEPSTTHRTLRERLELHQEVPSCRGCHRLLDGIGLSFENFDAIGRFRREDNGAVIDPSGVLDTLPFRDAVGLAETLRDHPEFSRCVVRRLYRHAYAHVEAEPQRAEIDRLAQGFAASGYRLRGLLRSIALGDAFRLAAPLESGAPMMGSGPAGDAGASDAATNTEGGR